MNLKIEELKRILSWFDIAEVSLGDKDLDLYDDIKEYVSDCGYEDMAVDSDSSDEESEIDCEENIYDSDDYGEFSKD